MPRDKSVDNVIDLEPGERLTPNPETAQDALEGITFNEGEAPQPAPEALRAPEPPKPKRRTKAELEAEVVRLAAEVEQQRAAAAASAPDLIRAMVHPLAMTFRSAGNVMAAWRGDFWRLSDTETKDLAEAWAPCIGPLLSKHPEAIMWAAAIGATYSVAYPRLAQEKMIAAKEREATDLSGKTEVVIP